MAIYYLKSGKVDMESVSRISELSQEICYASELEDLKGLVTEHEKIISKVTGKTPLGETRFKDLPVTVKSLGAWGGDFAMFVSELSYEDLQPLLASKGVEQLFTFNTISF